MPMDPSLEGKGVIGAKADFDLTLPLQSRGKFTMRVARAPRLKGPPRHQTVLQSLENHSPLYFTDIVDALGSRDSREIVLQLEALREGKLMRNSNGQYLLGKTERGTTGLFGLESGDPDPHS